MVGQGDAPADQTKEEIAQAATTKITRSKRPVRNEEKAVEKNKCLHKIGTAISPGLTTRGMRYATSGAPPQVQPSPPNQSGGGGTALIPRSIALGGTGPRRVAL
jgi:hypothetical protein